MPNNPRSYGLGESTQYCKGKPEVKCKTGLPCPNCGCETTYMIQVTVDHPQLHNRNGVGSYVGCPACPWASPMVMVAR